MMDRALALDEAFDYGAIHAYFITYEMSRPGGMGDPAARSRQHFERALALSGGQQAGPMLSFAEAVCVQKQDLKEFESLLHHALAINPDAKPEWRLANLVMQRRAKWLLARTDQLFLRASPTGEGKLKSETRKLRADQQSARGYQSKMSMSVAACQPLLCKLQCSRIGRWPLRTSTFGLLSDFGFRASDFCDHAHSEWQGRRTTKPA